MPRKQHSHHFLYKTTCLITNKFYYGMHSTSNLEDGYFGSGKRLWLSINKHSRSNHTIEKLKFFDSRNELIRGEIELITDELLKDPMCMNIASGGDGGTRATEEQLQRGGYSSGSIHKLKISNDLNYKNQHLERFHKHCMSKSPSKPTGFLGRTHSKETKKKMSDSKKITQAAERNSQFGSIWIHNNIENKKIKKIDLQSYLNKK